MGPTLHLWRTIQQPYTGTESIKQTTCTTSPQQHQFRKTHDPTKETNPTVNPPIKKDVCSSSGATMEGRPGPLSTHRVHRTDDKILWGDNWSRTVEGVEYRQSWPVVDRKPGPASRDERTANKNKRARRDRRSLIRRESISAGGVAVAMVMRWRGAGRGGTWRAISICQTRERSTRWVSGVHFLVIRGRWRGDWGVEVGLTRVSGVSLCRVFYRINKDMHHIFRNLGQNMIIFRE